VATNAALFPEPSPGLGATSESLIDSYRRLAAVFHEVLAEQSPEVLLDRIADTLAELVPYQDLHIYEADEQRRELVPVFARSAWAEEILNQRIQFGQGITGWAVAHRSPVLANDAHLDPRVEFVAGTPRDPEALITVPLIARGQLKGALNIYRVGEDAKFDEDDFELARWFGDAAALSLDNAQIRARLEHLAHTDSLTGLYNHRYFHERLRAELHRASRAHDTVALLMLDIDDFKRVNDVCGHGEGDHVLQYLAQLLKGVARTSDTVCRVGGEEFAVILPSCTSEDALGLAARVKDALLESPAESVGAITLSTGIAFGPEHAMNARELVACAEAAMMTAKAQGKDRVVVFADAPRHLRPADDSAGRDIRSIAHLKMLQSLARKLNRLNDVREIGEAIVDELRMLIDYHNCCVYLLDGEKLAPIAIRGANQADLERFELRLGEGLTGHVALTGRPALVPTTRESELTVDVVNSEADESLACAPLRYGPRVIGAITISKLGIAQFDEDDLRLLEVLAGHASVSLENARLYDSLRREAENAKAWLEFSDAVTEARTVEAIGDETVRSVARLLEVEQCSMWIEDAHAANYRCLASSGYDDPSSAAVLERRYGRTIGAHLIDGRKTPFLAGDEEIRRIFASEKGADIRPAAVAPLHQGFGMRGWITVRAPEGDLTHFTDERLRLLEGLAYRASVALQKSTLLQSEQASAEVASKLLEFSRRLAGVSGADDLHRRIVELTGEMLDSPRTWLWLERGRPGSFAIAAAWRDDGAVPIVPIGSVVEFGGTRRALERGEPFVLEPGTVDLVPDGEDPLAVAPVVLPSGRIGCIAAAAPEAFAERKLRLLAGIANQASLALHIAQS
jgi:diguanylate cyclase (GGDEF)-like protein